MMINSLVYSVCKIKKILISKHSREICAISWKFMIFDNFDFYPFVSKIIYVPGNVCANSGFLRLFIFKSVCPMQTYGTNGRARLAMRPVRMVA